MEKFNYPWEMMPLLIVILKNAKGDTEEASRQLLEGNYYKTKFITCTQRIWPKDYYGIRGIPNLVFSCAIVKSAKLL